jgi:hypothetical protein
MRRTQLLRVITLMASIAVLGAFSRPATLETPKSCIGQNQICGQSSCPSEDQCGDADAGCHMCAHCDDNNCLACISVSDDHPGCGAS